MASSSFVSPFAPTQLPSLPVLDGVAFATAEAGIRYKGRTDLMIATMPPTTVAAGVTTTSKTCSAPVLWCREQLGTGGQARILVVNSGNANAFTGKRGEEAVRLTAEAAASAVGCGTSAVFIASTGVIGEPLNARSFTGLIPAMLERTSPVAWEAAARTIMTTDTYPKLATHTSMVGGHPVTISGFCKGAGMIAPDMATMLCFIFTDAAIEQQLLQRLVSSVSDETFNCITIDGDTSTSDTLLVFATATSVVRGAPVISNIGSAEFNAFRAGLHTVMQDLALQVVRDGEGLSKFVRINVCGAEDDRAARRIAFAIANSPIMKTAIAGEDPNWGRVVMAVGKSGELADRDRLSIWFGPHLVANQGERAESYVENVVAAYMKHPELEISVDVGICGGKSTVWTCDLTHDYVSINADYRS